MSGARARSDAPVEPALTEVEAEAARDESAARISLEEIAEPDLAAPLRAAPAPVLRTARVLSVAPSGARCTIAWREGAETLEAEVSPDVERAVVDQACEERGRVLVEVEPGGVPLVVGAVATRAPRRELLRGETVTIEAEREILLKTGRAGLRLREDGDIELVGSRISAASRGLFRLMGRILRLN